jgi:ATP-binding cassette, subfamily B, multidrug efflux pump
MRIFDAIYRRFESWIDPFVRLEDYRPPDLLVPYAWHYVRQAKWAFFALLLYGFANAIIEASLFTFVGRTVDIMTGMENAGDRAGGWSGLWQLHGGELLLMLGVVAIGRAVVIAWGALIEEQVIVPGFFTMMRWQSHKQIISQSMTFFENDLSGRVAQKVMQSGQATGDMMIALLQVIWFIIVYSVTTLALLSALDLRLGVLVLVWIAFFVVIARRYIPRIRHHGRLTAEAAAVTSGRLVDGYTNIKTVKLNAGSQAEEKFVREAMESQYASLKLFTRALSGVRISLNTVSGLMIGAISIFAVHLWLQGAITQGQVAFTLAMVLRLNLLLGRLMGNLNGFFRAAGTAQNTMDMVSKPVELLDSPDAEPLRFRGGEIEVDRVSFDYGGGDNVIRDLSLTVKPGEKVGLVGPSGAGKSTLVDLILRFYTPSSGVIRFDGQDIGKVTQDSLRAHFSLVQQETALFHRSVRENIGYGNEAASMEAIVSAARKAKAHDFILQLSDSRGRRGYEARVGERGVKLSGGQRQRIAIARIFLKDAPILILDEATSQLDSEIEAAIQENLLELMKSKTVIAIAHRLSTIAAMDRLIVMDDGMIVEEGTHQSLLSGNGLYARLWHRQSGGFIAEQDEIVAAK